MSDLEEMMKSSVRQVLKNSIDDYLVKARNDWVLVHPGQCVLNGSQVHWTSEVEIAILKGLQGVKDYHLFLIFLSVVMQLLLELQQQSLN